MNRYAYANGNPVSLVDPFGLAAENRKHEDNNFKEENWFEKVLAIISQNVGGAVSCGQEITLNSEYYFFTTVEQGVGYNKSFGHEKPVTFFASVGENWWEFWEWSIGIDVNINGYGGGISVGPETSINIHAGDISHEIGANAVGRIFCKTAYHEDDGYVYQKSSLNTPETVGVLVLAAAALYYGGPAVVPAALSVAGAVLG